MNDDMSRRDFVRRVGLGTIGLGFGVSVFDGLFHYAEALTEEQKHAMLMKGTVNFMGFTAKEITPNEEFISLHTPARCQKSTQAPSG